MHRILAQLKSATCVTVCALLLALHCVRDVHAQANCSTAANDCFTANLIAPGCNNSDCCSTVCLVEPTCCDVAWDDVCVSLAHKFCNTCGTGGQSCFKAHTSPSCSEADCCNGVCGIDPTCCNVAWDADCVVFAESMCKGCGAEFGGSCLTVHAYPGCNNADCCELVSAFDPMCESTAWDAACVNWATRFCPECGSQFTQSCCYEHNTPFCNDRVCCEAVCASDTYCCEVRWDFQCAQAATTLCGLPACTCGSPAAGSCKTVHATTGCDDFRCCNDVCAVDSFCCAIEWDFTCTSLANATCTLGPFAITCGSATGSCYTLHQQGGCNDPACCTTVCTLDPSCCDKKWDERCVAAALLFCNGCGDINAGSCFFAHGTPSCLDRECCETVCALDPSCCVTEWDILCVTGALGLCDTAVPCGDPRSRPCGVASSLPGCSDAACCAEICNFDPTCCIRAWDETCAAAATYTCGRPPNCPSRGNPYAVHALPGCVDAFCCTAVCEVEPTCCVISWDQYCVDAAFAVCYSASACPGIGPCDLPHASPGCSEQQCCQIVCAGDPSCCDDNWDIYCAQRAKGTCTPAPSWNCPCDGSCFEAHPENPGCNDAVCCAGVCGVDPLCCTASWDQHCATIARVVCCGIPSCGNYCAGSCFVVHSTPFCSDPVCCEAVCRFDPVCCTNRWDSSCVNEARETCNGGCGLPSSGNCFAQHDLPGCANPVCCEAVCADVAYMFCCIVSWDEVCAQRALDVCADAPQCGDAGLGDCCRAHDGPSCFDRLCCEAICAVDVFCCDVQWDESCAESTFSTDGCSNCQPECGGICAGECCRPHRTPWCNDTECCEAVCVLDLFCCAASWDDSCAARANTIKQCRIACPDPLCGASDAGNCCAPHDNANCNDASCCEEVCKIDSYCCDTQWDTSCALIARENCNGEGDACDFTLFCGSPDAQGCCDVHETPYCSNAACCAFVCKFNSACCEVSWDETCVKLATTFCPDCQ